MKRLVSIFVFLGGLLSVLSLYAQTGTQSGTRFGRGQDSVQCVRHLSLYQTDYQQRNFDAAIVNWRKIWRDCPLSSVNLTPQGATMYKFYIDRELNADIRAALVDTLIQVWERGIELRPQARANYQTSLMQDLLRYADTPENEAKTLALLRDMGGFSPTQVVIQRPADAPPPPASVYATYMRMRFTQNREGRLSDEELIDAYDVVSSSLSTVITQTSSEELARVRDVIDDQFVNSNASTRENLLRIYGGRRYDENRDNPVYLRRVTGMLSQREYTDTELFENASERLYELSPTPDAAFRMGQLFLGRNNLSRAVEYFEEAIRTEENAIDKARYNFLLGGIMMTRYTNRHVDAKRYTLEAIRLRPDWGEPYILLSTIYDSGPKCGNDDFEQRQVYWVIVDRLQRARTVDPDVAPRVDPLIRRYSAQFPRREEGFFRNIAEGITITVGCWINESTRVRYTN